MNVTDRRLITCISITVFCLLMEIYLLMLDCFTSMQFVISNYDNIIRLILTFSIIGVIWFGMVRDLVLKPKDK